MSDLHPLGFGLWHGASDGSDAHYRYQVNQIALRRVLEFTGRSINDVVNDPIARNEIFGYYKLHRQIERHCEATELERQWNPRRVSL